MFLPNQMNWFFNFLHNFLSTPYNIYFSHQDLLSRFRKNLFFHFQNLFTTFVSFFLVHNWGEFILYSSNLSEFEFKYRQFKFEIRDLAFLFPYLCALRVQKKILTLALNYDWNPQF